MTYKNNNEFKIENFKFNDTEYKFEIVQVYRFDHEENKNNCFQIEIEATNLKDNSKMILAFQNNKINLNYEAVYNSFSFYKDGCDNAYNEFYDNCDYARNEYDPISDYLQDFLDENLNCDNLLIDEVINLN